MTSLEVEVGRALVDEDESVIASLRKEKKKCHEG